MSDFFIGFTGLFSIINPFGGAFVFLDMARYLSPRDQSRLARIIAINSLCVLLVSLYFGVYILSFFGISLEALRIGGGIAVAVSGWRMLNGTNTTPHAPSSMDTAPVWRMSFFPLTVPLTTGPGTMATAVALGANHASRYRLDDVHSFVMPLVAISMAASIYVAYRFSRQFARIVGSAGTEVITRINAFFLLCVGVQIILTGFMDSLSHTLSHIHN